MPRYVLDTSALLTLHYNEPGNEHVAGLLALTLEAETPALPNVAVFACFMSLTELLYNVWKTEGEGAGRAAYADCLALPVIWVHETPALLELAASLKARYPISLGNAWIAATALQCDAVLVHKDPEFESVPALQNEPLPYKSLGTPHFEIAFTPIDADLSVDTKLGFLKETPLSLASSVGNLPATQKLFELGAYPNPCGRIGYSPLEHALFCSAASNEPLFDIASDLIKKGGKLSYMGLSRFGQETFESFVQMMQANQVTADELLRYTEFINDLRPLLCLDVVGAALSNYPPPLQNEICNNHFFYNCNETGKANTLETLRKWRQTNPDERIAFVGFGGPFNYSLIAAIRPEVAFIFDLSETMVDFHRSLLPTLAYGSDLAAQFKHQSLACKDKRGRIKSDDPPFRMENWVNDPESCVFLKNLAGQGRIYISRQDASAADDRFVMMNAVIRSYRLVPLVYSSNICDWAAGYTGEVTIDGYVNLKRNIEAFANEQVPQVLASLIYDRDSSHTITTDKIPTLKVIGNAEMPSFESINEMFTSPEITKPGD